jgi:hypothetical protein
MRLLSLKKHRNERDTIKHMQLELRAFFLVICIFLVNILHKVPELFLFLKEANTC